MRGRSRVPKIRPISATPNAIKAGLTVTENLRLAAAGRPVGPALQALGLGTLADLRARMLSAGQRRRLALARLPLSRSPLWLLDEPTLGLDTASLGLLAHVLAVHRAAGGGVIAATHQDLDLPGAEDTAAAFGANSPFPRAGRSHLTVSTTFSLREGRGEGASVSANALFRCALGPHPDPLP